MHGAGRGWIERQFELFVPIKEEPRVAWGVVAIAGAWPMACDVSRVGRNFVGDHSLLYVFRIWEAEMLFGRHITQHGSSVPSNHGGADRAGNVVIARRDINHERPEGIEGRFMAPFHLLVDLLLDLVQRNMAWAFDHYLNIVLPGFGG